MALLALAIAVSQLATSMYLPALPAMGAELRVGPAAASWTLTIFYVGFALSSLAAGPLADRWGRRPVLLGGMLLALSGDLICALAPDIVPLMEGRLVQALGAGVAPVVARAMLRDVQGAGDGTRAMLWVSIAMAASPALGPPLGGLVQQQLGWRWEFWLLAAAGAVVTAAIAWRLDETLPPAARRGAQGLLGRYAGLLRDPAYRLNVGALSCLFAGLGVFFATGPFLFIRLMGMSPLGYGLLNLGNVAAYLFGSLLAGRLAGRWGRDALVRRGAALSLSGGVLMVLLAIAGIVQPLAVLGPVMLVTAGFGMVLPAATAGALERHPDQAGLASALLGFIQIGAAAAGTALAGALLGLGGTLPVACVFLGLTAGALACARGLGRG